ncbi:MAG TPA: hypothetical protein VLM11_15400 [Streptosporangiaceae bacterium]|nr:hypothetical protein [Streptosporangiaceae bacterium]
MNSNHRADSALARARQVAARLQPVARRTGSAAKHGVRTTRAWAAPQLERTGDLMQDRIAPRISSLLSSAAQRIEPGKPRRRRWRKMAGASMVTAAAGAVTGAFLNRRRQDGTPSDDQADSHHEGAARYGQVDAQTGAEADQESEPSSS